MSILFEPNQNGVERFVQRRTIWQRFWKWLVGIFGIGIVLAGGFVLLPNKDVEQIIIANIQIAQTAYYQKYGRYFQGLSTDDLNIKPHYQTEKWSDFISLPAQLPFQMEINTYKAPKGDGYWIVLRKTVQVQQFNSTTSQMETVDKILTKSVGYGLETTNYSHDWK